MKEKTAAQDKVLRTNQVKNWIDNDNVSPNLMCQFRDGGMYFVLGEGGGGGTNKQAPETLTWRGF